MSAVFGMVCRLRKFIVYLSHPGAKQPDFGCIWCKSPGVVSALSRINPEKSRNRLFGINLATLSLCCYSYLFSCVDVALWLVEVLRAVRAHFFVRDKAIPA
ncbi:hypothetical protein RO575_02860 [Methylomonas sp. MO1]|uniref:hypothetical protein n=1 Tax=Methylomonas sp. MO1 TaxID=3073619 RepID=UPI0028A4A9AF|nr:hypothetical protein [Methylomonas sp. MO1]MDT4288488.1 hypothetical protein [Methylomonas sp. MO1]